MNHLCFLFVMALCIGLSNTNLWEKNLVQFKNSVGKQINIFCKLNDKQLFNLSLNPGEIYDYRFHGEFVTTNKMDCDIREIIQNRFVRIRAYQGSSGSFDHGKTNYWDIREDGVYFTHGKDVPKLEYKW
ncbi:putative plant self-incompatibility S1 [Arabidopsis thaliana]